MLERGESDDDADGALFLAPGGAAFVPPADVLASDEEVLVQMDVPGLSAENLAIELENDVLTVRGERAFSYGSEREGDGDGGGYAWQLIELSFGRFERLLRAGLDPERSRRRSPTGC